VQKDVPTQTGAPAPAAPGTERIIGEVRRIAYRVATPRGRRHPFAKRRSVAIILMSQHR
jgi:hypothetical protein